MRFEFNVEVEVERDEGKFVSREELGEEIRGAIESADPASIEAGFDGSTYNVESWDVNEVEQLPKGSRPVVLTRAEHKLVLRMAERYVSEGIGAQPARSLLAKLGGSS